MTKPHRPPLPTCQQVARQWDLGIDNVTRLIARIKPQRFDGALCAGKAPLFDPTPHPDETAEQFAQRSEYMRNHCQVCPIGNCPYGRKVRRSKPT